MNTAIHCLMGVSATVMEDMATVTIPSMGMDIATPMEMSMDILTIIAMVGMWECAAGLHICMLWVFKKGYLYRYNEKMLKSSSNKDDV